MKADVLAAVASLIDRRLEEAATALRLAEEASKDNTKSSAGDKYETTREMMQQQIDNNRKLLFEAGRQKTFLQQLPAAGSDKVRNGSLVETDQGWFFIGVSGGTLQVSGKAVTAISQASPLGKVLADQQAGAQVSFNGRHFRILQVI